MTRADEVGPPFAVAMGAGRADEELAGLAATARGTARTSDTALVTAAGTGNVGAGRMITSGPSESDADALIVMFAGELKTALAVGAVMETVGRALTVMFMTADVETPPKLSVALAVRL